MRISVFIFLAFLVSSCSQSKLADIIDHTSAMEIRFTDSTGYVTGIYKSNFSGEINMLNKYFTGDEVPQYKCGYDGKIILKGKDTTEIDFSVQNKCQHISFMLDGTLYSEDISLEGIGYLKKLRFKVNEIPPAPTQEIKEDTLNSAK
ncbi:MAG: hypothetical protein AB7P01_13545 [Bacteroidia bacterium]